MRIFLLWIILLGWYAPVFAQNTKMTRVKLSYEDKPLDLIFLDLKLKYGIDIEYPKEYARNKRVTISLSPLPIDKALPYLLSGTPLGFAIQGDKIVIQERGESEAIAEAPSADTPRRHHFEVSGTIKDQVTGEALPFANISVRGTTNGASANVDGYFTLFNVPSDTVVLVASYIGYPNTYFRLRPDMASGPVLIRMNPQAIQLQEIVVEGEKKEQVFQAATGVSQITLSPKALLQVPSIGERDLFRSLQLLPGISGSQESSSGLYVRGGTPDQNLILFDGFTVYHVDHLFGFFSAFNANAVKDIQLFKGGFDARYGGRISSVVDITGKDGNTEQVNASAGISSISYNASIETPFRE
ncbi:MAG: carboxypeptidase-like regulatory domain-containing protein, partial [Haliscomenobacter sp.]